MKKRTFFLLSAVILGVLSLSAQRKRIVRPTLPKPTLTECIARYDFTTAAQILHEMAVKAAPLTRRDSLLVEARKMERAADFLSNTERVVFIDSVVVDKVQLLSVLRLSTDAGRLVSTASLFRSDPTRGIQLGMGTYINPLETAAISSLSAPGGTLRLQSAYRSANGWEKPRPLEGIDSTFAQADMPYLLSDGTTLYFAAEGPESVGGYDIFVTRYNPETRQYVRPANIGMPFNSPANDYLYLIDEGSGVGYFATDRRQPVGKVCLYTFLPNTERNVYDAASMPTDSLLRAAQISCIADTQVGHERDINEAQVRRKVLQNSSISDFADFRFVLNDERVCTNLADFQNDQARKQALVWYKQQQQLAQFIKRREVLQRDYGEMRTERMAQELRQLEIQIAQLNNQLREMAKAIRKNELQ